MANQTICGNMKVILIILIWLLQTNLGYSQKQSFFPASAMVSAYNFSSKTLSLSLLGNFTLLNTQYVFSSSEFSNHCLGIGIIGINYAYYFNLFRSERYPINMRLEGGYNFSGIFIDTRLIIGFFKTETFELNSFSFVNLSSGTAVALALLPSYRQLGTGINMILGMQQSSRYNLLTSFGIIRSYRYGVTFPFYTSGGYEGVENGLTADIGFKYNF